ncbi:hypothetical protein ABZW96_35065 [Nocardia sp. NPDC004168]|uniref:hypothetical protein n=1 Tax=Nocardia sp. NPDC004168 TaxID=3154452 RepID=UPI0033ACAF8A
MRQIVNTGEHEESEAALRQVRRHSITRDNLRRAITKLVNATFAARDPLLPRSLGNDSPLRGDTHWRALSGWCRTTSPNPAYAGGLWHQRICRRMWPRWRRRSVI